MSLCEDSSRSLDYENVLMVDDLGTSDMKK